LDFHREPVHQTLGTVRDLLARVQSPYDLNDIAERQSEADLAPPAAEEATVAEAQP